MSDNQPSLETVTSVDQLLQLVYPEYSLLQHCLRKKAWQASSSPSYSPTSARPSVHSDDDDLWGHPREEALYKSDGTFEGMKNVKSFSKKHKDGGEFRRKTEQWYLK